MRISDWSSDVCSSDLGRNVARSPSRPRDRGGLRAMTCKACGQPHGCGCSDAEYAGVVPPAQRAFWARCRACGHCRSEEHTSELQSLMRISYAVFCLKKKTQQHTPKKKITYINNIS